MTDLEQHRKRYAAINAECESLNSRIAGLHRLAGEVAEAEARLKNFDGAAAEHYEAWATGGCEGDPPRPDHGKRAELVAAVEAARAHETAARAAADGLTTKLRELQSRRDAAERELKSAVAAALAAEADQLVDELRVGLEKLGETRAKVNAACAYLHESDHHQPAAAVQARLYRVLNEPMREIGDLGEWRSRFNALISGTP